MKYSFAILLFLLPVLLNGQENKSEENWIPLFNGKDLDDWVVKISGYELGDNFGNTFRVEDGMMKVAYDAYDKFDNRFGHIMYRLPFSSYRIRVEYRFVGEQAPEGPGWAYRNSGIMVHGQAPETMTKDQDFPISIEVQLLGGSGEGERSTANLCTPGTHVVMDGKLEETHCINYASETFHGDQWVTVEVLVKGNDLIEHYVNGEKVMSYTQPQVGGGVVNQHDEAAKKDGMMLHKGYISLQSESHPIEFRKVELLKLE